MKDCFFNKVKDIYEIYIDETKKNKATGYGVFFKHNS